jgi:arginyl-tRNA--protein-N-Asp/Glu arginylyltransferase
VKEKKFTIENKKLLLLRETAENVSEHTFSLFDKYLEHIKEND